MKKLILFITILYLMVTSLNIKKSYTQIKDTFEAWIDYSKQDSINGIYIPIDMEDCLKQLDSFWNDSIKSEIKKMSLKDFTGQAHHGIGMWIRNNWGLWVSSRLTKYFNSFGFTQPDDMSGAILELYYRKLDGEDIHLEKWRK